MRIVLSLAAFAQNFWGGKLHSYVSLLNTTMPLSLAVMVVVAGTAMRFPPSAFIGILVLACMPVFFVAWLWKGKAIVEAVILHTPMPVSDPLRSTVVSGIFGAVLVGVLLIAAGQIAPIPSLSRGLILALSTWGLLAFANLGYWLGRHDSA